MRIKAIIAITILLILTGSLISMQSNTPKRDIGNYFLSYRPGMIDYMKKFDLVVTDVRGYSRSEIDSLKRKGITVTGYISCGETEKLEIGDGLGPGGYASWYFDLDNDNVPDRNPIWKSYYTNTANTLWIKRVIDVDAKNVLKKGADGFFLDTVDTVDLYPETKEAMIYLIKKLREKYPGKLIIQNRGFCILESTAPYINAVMWESWYPDTSDTWVIDWQNRLNELRSKYGIKILVLGYYDKYNNFERYYEASKEHGFIPYIGSDEEEDKIVNFFSERRIGTN